MLETFKTFDLMLQTYWVLAAVSSLVFIIQAISTFIGLGADTDADFSGGDTDFDVDGFHLISIKTVICFILGFGWTGVLFWDSISNRMLLGLLALIIGLVFMCVIALLLRWVMKLDKDNTFHISQAVGQTAEVYLHIPANRKETGKVIVSLNGSVHELEALNNSAEDIPTGSKVKIIDTVDNSILLVEKI